MDRNLDPLTEYVNRRLQEEVIKNRIPLPSRNGVQYILATNHVPERIMESLWFIGIILNWEEKSIVELIRPDGTGRLCLPTGPHTRPG